MSAPGNVGRPPEYAAPALEKGLDVLELLADAPGPLSQSEVAAALGRSVGQLFRVLTTLERRGYVVRTEEGGYLLSVRLFDLASRHAPLRGLLAASAAPMRALAEALGQSCNLGVREGDTVRVVAQAESPTPFGFVVRVGSTFPLDQTLTGEVLLAFTADQDGMGRASDSLGTIRQRGFGERGDSLHPGITDVAAPIVGPDGRALAALTVPYVATSYSAGGLDQVRARLREAATDISRALGGRASAPAGSPR